MIRGIKKADETKRKKRDRAVKLQDELRAKGGVWNGAAEVRRRRLARFSDLEAAIKKDLPRG